MPTYEAVLNGNNNLAQIVFDAVGPPGNSPGRNFLGRCLQANISPNNNMSNLATWFHLSLIARGWIWDPGVPGNSYTAGGRLLDGTVNRGECAFPAYALAYLINAPAPYGFGVGGAQVVSYRGAHNDGFIAVHNNALPGPEPNITRPQGDTLPGYYYWGNHKVVQFGGMLYDPCYNTVYPNVATMYAASPQITRQNVRLRDLSDYNPLSPWGLLLVWGLPRLMALKTSDLLFSTRHTISVLQVVNARLPALNGFYIEWVENWRGGGRGTTYGPYPNNPLVR